MLANNANQPVQLFSSSLCVLRQLLFCAVILALLFPPDTSSADGSTSHSRKTGLSSRPSTPVAKSNIQRSLIISPDADEFSQNPKLLARILRGPHGYFRFINEIFAEEVCGRFRDDLGWIPNVNLQGDAPLENYAITERGRGLTDFDAATMGPAVLDLVRFGVSIHLAYQPYRYAGFIIFALRKGDERDKTFWVHEWADHYHELSIRTSFQTVADLHDIAYDAGVQLGLGHPKSIADSYSNHLRGRLLITVAELQVKLDRTISDLTQQTIAAWQQFRIEATTRKARPNGK